MRNEDFLVPLFLLLVMHILEIPSFFTPYGGEFCLDQAKALKAVGHEVRILSNVQLGATIGLKDYLSLPYNRYVHERDGITVCQSFQRGVPMVIRWNVKRWVQIVCSMFDNYVGQYGVPDILHAHCSKWAGYAAMQISRKYHLPYVITEHLSRLVFEKEFGPAPSNAWQIPLLKEAYENADLVIPVSEELVDNIACYFGKDYRWQAVSNTIDVDFFHYQSRQPLQGRMFRFCCLANNWPMKGYDILIPAFRQLRESGQNVELHIAGRGTDSAEFRSMMSDGMVTHGLISRNDVRELLYQSDALVLASRSEVQPLSLLEAMSTGIPVIATECVPLSLRIEGGSTIVPIDDVEAMKKAMSDVVGRPTVDGRWLSQEVLRIASPEVVGRKLEKLFSGLVTSD
jgi:glycosyltransferase involved in cell wall biosynthesis